MCGRYGVSLEAEDYVDAFSLGSYSSEELKPRYDIRPTEVVPVIQKEGGLNRLRMFKWGYHPSWAKHFIINTRLENMFHSSYSKKSALFSRCIVPASFFYEWQDQNGKTVPWKIYPKDDSFFAMAGLRFSQAGETEGEKINVVSIVTMKANSFMEKIHNRGKNPFRQPAILQKQYWEEWLNPENSDAETIERILPETAAGQMAAVALEKIGNDKTHVAPIELK
ncbi:MAG: SOS response-associated peptidase [Leptospirales bacterium]